MTRRRFHNPHIILHDQLDRTRRIATLERDHASRARARARMCWEAAAGLPYERVSTAGRTTSFVAPVRLTPAGAGAAAGQDDQRPAPSQQRFEWRPTGGADVALLGIRRGWKLVWLRDSDPAAEGGTARTTRDGEEVVAVAGHVTRNYTLSERGALFQLEPRRLFSLKFVGLGREPGLGEPWEVLVVLTWLGLWSRWWKISSVSEGRRVRDVLDGFHIGYAF